MVIVPAGGDVDRAESRGKTKVDFTSIVHWGIAVKAAHVAIVGVAEAHRGRTEVVRNGSAELKSLVTPDGRRVEARHWARDLGVNLHPTVIFFDDHGREAFRFDGYLRPFHIESDYVASGAWKTEPQFQRFLQARHDRLQAGGRRIDLWK